MCIRDSHHRTYPNGIVRQNTYHSTLNLVTAIGYRKGADGELAAGHEDVYKRQIWQCL